MFTRQDYLNNNCTHQEYYNQFVNDDIKKIVLNHFGYNKIKKSYSEDKNLNNIPLQSWDNLAYFLNFREEFKKYGDFESLASKVCILKNAARQIITENKEN